MSLPYKELQKLSDEQLIDLYDKCAKNTVVGLQHYEDELVRRQNERSNKIMVNCTIAITIMTAIMLLATIVNVIIAFIK